MKIFLMLLGAAICGGALLVWLFLNGLAAGWYTGGGRYTIDWLSLDALLWFWLPAAVGIAIAVVGWNRA